MAFKKIIGWILLASGIIIIFWSLYSAYNIFNVKTKAPEIFRIETKETSLQINSLEQDKIKSFTPSELHEEIKKIIDVQMKEIIPSEFISKLLNLISWSIFIGILILGGSKIASIGINLIKE